MDHLRKLYQKLTAPHSTNKSEAYQEYKIKAIFIILNVFTCAITLLFIILAIGKSEEFTPDLLIVTVVCGLSFGGGWWLAQRGHWQLSRYIPPTVTLLVALYGTYHYGASTTTVMAYTLALLLTTLLLENRAQWGMLLLSIGGLVGLEGSHAYLHTETYLVYQTITASLFLALIMFLLYAFNRQFQFTRMHAHLCASQHITASEQVQQAHNIHLRFLENMARVDRAIRQATDVEQMMSEVLQTTLEIFEADRAWLLYPCDPDAQSWNVPMEYTRPEYPGVLALREEVLMTPEAMEVFRAALEQDDVITVDYREPDTAQETATRFTMLTEMHMAIYPQTGKPWLFGIHQCSHYRDWSGEEQDLFREIGHRLSDGLSSMLSLRELRESEAKLLQAQYIAKMGDFTWDIQTGGASWSEGLHQLLKYDRDEVLNYEKVNNDVHHPDDVTQVTKWLMESIAFGKEELVPNEYRLICKDGEVIYVQTNGRIEYKDGKAVKLFGTCLDITERKLAEQERELLLARIRAQISQMQGIMNTVPEGVFLLDADARIVLANPVAENDLDFLAGAKVGDILTQLGDHPLVELLTSPPTKGLWHEVKMGGRFFEVIARPMEPTAAGQETNHWVLVINDVTQAREIQTQLRRQERLAAVGQLAAGIAHDFNNIMAIIILYAQLGLRRATLPTALRHRLEIIEQQAKRATDMIQQILDFSRRAVLERQPMDLTPFLKEVVKLLARTVPENIKIDLVFGGDDYMVHADPTRMQQAIMNLAINARDAMPEGGVLHIDLARIQVAPNIEPPLPDMAAGAWVRVRVSDTGSGISSEVLPYIFDPFFTTKEAGKGTGLGLAQVYGIMDAHEGYIDVSTVVGGGTTFTLYLPALQQRPESLPLATQDLIPGQGETILIVEDNAPLRQALASTLISLNYQVLEAANGRAALDLLEQFPPSPHHTAGIALVLSDLVMPEMGGQALFHAIQRRGLTVPIVMLSGHPMETELDTLLAQGLTGWLRKPPDMPHLTRLLAQALHENAESKSPQSSA